MKQKGKMSGKKMKQMLVTYTFVLPDFIGLLVFIIIPIIYSFYMSLYNWNFANVKEFIGLQNYVTMFSDSEWWQSLGRTFKLTLMYVPALFILSILFAVLINYVKNKKSGWICKNSFSASIFYHICNCKLSVDVPLYGKKRIYQCIFEGSWTEGRKVSGVHLSGNGLYCDCFDMDQSGLQYYSFSLSNKRHTL